MNTTTNQTVAQTISNQLGSALAMLGAHGLLDTGKGLLFGFKGCRKANKVRITLASDDTYTVEFFKVRGLDCATVAKVEGVYAQELKSTIREVTGLYVSNEAMRIPEGF